MMTALPFEVLVLTFEELSTNDLKQCQLVSKLWNQASLKRLYSVALIDTEEKSRLYVRTIESSPHLGKYLETIDTGDIFEKESESIVWDKHDLLDTVINHCPNLLNINHRTTSSPFWTKLMYAASQGQLSRLQNISAPGDQRDFDYYVYAALAFKNTIKTLDMPDLDSFAPNILYSESHPILCKNLNQFPCLQNLSVCYESQRPLSHYDALIDDCKHLKNLSILPSGCDEQIQNIMLPEINPHPNILNFECKWEFMKEDSQLNYVMKKFPNLKSLSIRCDGYDSEYFERDSPDVLLQFLHFVTNLQKLNLEMILAGEECVKVWADVIKEKYKNIELKVSLSRSGEFDAPVVFVKFYKQYQLSLQFDPSPVSNSLYSKLLTDSGRIVQRLILKLFCNITPLENTMFYTMEKIIHAIDLCPSLQYLELEYTYDLPFDDSITYRHSKVKSIKLIPAINGSSIGTFKNMSLIFPHLKEMEFNSDLVKFGKSEATIITMPYTSLDILKWKFINFVHNGDGTDFEIYVRLNTNSGERFYVALEDELSSIGLKHYNRMRSSKDFYLDITCQNLSKLQINNFTYTL